MSFSALQRAEIAEIGAYLVERWVRGKSFSALQRAEIAEIVGCRRSGSRDYVVSVLFNEPKLLKSLNPTPRSARGSSFSALQRAEIAEITVAIATYGSASLFQCSSTSRNC